MGKLIPGRIFIAGSKLVPTWEASCEGWREQGMVEEMARQKQVASMSLGNLLPRP